MEGRTNMDENVAKFSEKMKELLAPGGKFVFAADTVFDRCSEDSGYQTSVSVKTKEGFDLLLKGKNHYDETSQTQFSPSIYELYNGAELLQSESMDFQTHLYRYGEMEAYLIERLNPELNKKKEPLHLLENMSGVMIQNFSEESAFMKDFLVG